MHEPSPALAVAARLQALLAAQVRLCGITGLSGGPPLKSCQAPLVLSRPLRFARAQVAHHERV